MRVILANGFVQALRLTAEVEAGGAARDAPLDLFDLAEEQEGSGSQSPQTVGDLPPRLSLP